MHGWNDPVVAQTLEQHVLEAFKVGCTRLISRQVMESAKISSHLDAIGMGLALELCATIYAHSVARDSIEQEAVLAVDVPTSTWQFFKDAHADAWWFSWFTNRWPAKTRKIVKTHHFRVDVSKYNAFPDLAIDYPEEFGRSLKWIDYSTNMWTTR